MTSTSLELSGPDPAVVVTQASRALIREVGITAWAVLVDVSLDAAPGPAGWAARTSVRATADHLGLTPGTVARALARLRTAGLVQRRDDRDRVTGRFVESAYVLGTMAGIVPCVDCPHTAGRDTAGLLATDLDAVGRDVKQRLPEGMASVCCSLSGGGGFGRATEEGLGRKASGTGDGGGVAIVGQGLGSC
jgi:hypothetical protein